MISFGISIQEDMFRKASLDKRHLTNCLVSFFSIPLKTKDLINAFFEPYQYLIFCNMKFHAIIVICILFLISDVGKSTQIGLHTWLHDVMEGF